MEQSINANVTIGMEQCKNANETMQPLKWKLNAIQLENENHIIKVL